MPIPPARLRWHLLHWPLLVLALFLIGGLPILRTASARSGCPRVLTLGVNDYPPYHIRQPDGQWSGLDTELITAIATRAGCSLTLVETEGKRRLAELEHGRLDMTGAASMTPDRQIWGVFSAAYRAETVVLFMRRDDPRHRRILTVDDLLNQQIRIAIQPGAVYGGPFTALRQRLGASGLLTERLGSDDRLQMVARSRVDATPEDLFSGLYSAAATGLADSLAPSTLVLNDESVHLLFSRQSVPLEVVADINTAIEDLQQDGTFQAILTRYGLPTNGGHPALQTIGPPTH